MKWWLSGGTKTEGPFPQEHVIGWLKTGQIKSDTMACPEGGQEWKRLDEIADFILFALPPPADSSQKVLYCPSCGHTLQLPTAWFGRKVRCKNCERVFVLPQKERATHGARQTSQRQDAGIGGQVGQIVIPAGNAPRSRRAQFGVLTATIVLSSVALFLEGIGTVVNLGAAIDILWLLISLAAAATWLIFHYKLWAFIPTPYAETTPGKAVGYLFIPFYNFYWIFQSCCGVARSLNRLASDNNLSEVKASIPLATAYSVVFVAILVLSFFAGMLIGAAEEQGDYEAAFGINLCSFVVLSISSFVFWLLMVLNQRQMVEYLLAHNVPVDSASGLVAGNA